MLKILFLLNMIVSLVISLFLIIYFFKFNKDSGLRKIFFLFFLMGLIFLLPSAVFFSWIFNLGTYAFEDLLFIQSIIVFLESILLLIIAYQIKKNKKLFYLLFIYLIFIFSLIIGLNFSSFLLLSSLLLIMILFVLFLSIPNFSRISKLGIFYSSVSLFLQMGLLLENQFSLVAVLISNIIFLVFIFFFIRDLKKIPVMLIGKKKKLKHNHYLFDFLRYFIFIIILTNFIFIGTLAIHEAGHFFTAKLNSDCDLERIVYEGALPHTEILCNNYADSMNKIIFGGIFLPVIVAFLFFFGGGTFMKETSLLILGFNILISYKDFIDLGFSQTISTFFSMFGGGIIFLAIAILAKSRTTEEEFIHLSDS